MMYKFKVELHHTRMLDECSPEVKQVRAWGKGVKIVEAWSFAHAVEDALNDLTEKMTLFVCNNEVVAVCLLETGPDAGAYRSYEIFGERKVVWTLQEP